MGSVAAEASFYHLGERDMPGRSTRDRSLDTYGGRLMRDPAASRFDGEVEAFYQSGTVSASTAPGAARLPVSAWFVHAAGYTFPGVWKARLSAQYDRASGDGSPGAYRRFDTLYGMRRSDLAPAGLYNAVGRANISTPGLKIEIAPSSRWDAFATYHALWLASQTDSFSTTGVRDATGRSGAFAGHQFDGRFLENAPNVTVKGTTAYGSLNPTAYF
jgi:hypothetical protein